MSASCLGANYHGRPLSLTDSRGTLVKITVVFGAVVHPVRSDSGGVEQVLPHGLRDCFPFCQDGTIQTGWRGGSERAVVSSISVFKSP